VSGGNGARYPFSSPGFRCCYLGCGSTLPRASSVASSSSAVSSSVKSRIFFWRADLGIARISGVRGVNNLAWVFSGRLAHGYLSVRQRTERKAVTYPFGHEMRLSVYFIEPLFNVLGRRVFPSDIRRCAPLSGRGRH